MNSDGRANFCLKSANRKSAILGLILQYHIRIFFRCASPKIANPQIFMINPQIANLQILCLMTVLKADFKNIFFFFFIFCVKLTSSILGYFCKEKSYVFCEHVEVLSPEFANHKKIGFENRKSAKCHICGKPQNENYLILQIFGFAKVTTADRPLL